MKKFMKDFGTFIAKGNALDLAVGIVIGSAFNAIIKSLVDDLIMPLIGLLFKADLTNLYVVLRGTATYDSVLGQLILSEDAVLLKYGNFLQSIMNFLTIALAIFLALKVIMALRSRLDQAKEVILGENNDK